MAAPRVVSDLSLRCCLHEVGNFPIEHAEYPIPLKARHLLQKKYLEYGNQKGISIAIQSHRKSSHRSSSFFPHSGTPENAEENWMGQS